MSERLTKFEDFFHAYAGRHKDQLNDDLLMAVIEQAFYAGAMGGVGCIANRIAELEATANPAEVINGISQTILLASSELEVANEKLKGPYGTA